MARPRIGGVALVISVAPTEDILTYDRDEYLNSDKHTSKLECTK